jgi:hypothetical protein
MPVATPEATSPAKNSPGPVISAGVGPSRSQTRPLTTVASTLDARNAVNGHA